MRSPIPSEFQEQCTFVDWLALKGLKFSALPLSTYTNSWNQKRQNYQMGVRAGVPDLLIIISPKQSRYKRGHVLFIELKRTKDAKVSESQKEWIHAINECDGVEAKVCYGHEQAMQFVNEFL